MSGMKWLPAFLLLPLLFSCAQAGESYAPHVPEEGKKDWTAFVCSDPHYLSSSLHDDGEAFHLVYEESGDGKMASYSDTLFDCFVEEALRAKPDAVLLLGDLTFNGETRSHQEVAKGCKRLLEAGIQPLIISGNHDIDQYYSYSYSGDSVKKVPSPTYSEFREIYFPYGLQQSFSRMEKSFSYAYQASEDLVLLALDGSPEKHYEIGEAGLSFAEEVLKQAKERNQKVLPFSHRSALVHHPNFTDGYALADHEALSNLYKEYGVTLSLAGHWHIQHIQEEAGYSELLTGPLCVLENSYGILSFEKGEFSYHKKSLDMASYAARHQLSDPVYSDFRKASYAIFDSMSRRSFSDERRPAEIPTEDYAILRESFVHFNRSYFLGEPVDSSLYEEEMTLWNRYESWRRSQYMEPVFLSLEKDHRIYPQ